ncbi:MAG: FAD-binding protein [Deltaproteobacteria bacterium]|nr:FAD-binding protein [Deltaproteobacteria bacterium]
MTNVEIENEVHTADVLILGAGLAGYIVANRVKELNPELSVLIVEKSTAGWSGSKANKGAGVMWVMEEKDDVGKFMEYYSAHHGHGLEDQELLEKVCGTTLEMVGHLERWGVNVAREADGSLARSSLLPLWALCAFDLDRAALPDEHRDDLRPPPAVRRVLPFPLPEPLPELLRVRAVPAEEEVADGERVVVEELGLLEGDRSTRP